MNEKFSGGFKNKKEVITNEQIAKIGREIIAQKEREEREIVKEIMDAGRNEKERGEIPMEEEITKIIKDLIFGNRFEVSREIKDETGTILREINIPTKDGHIEYEYMRKGRHGKMKSTSSNISIAFYNKDGIPEDGYIVARYEDGKWNLIT